MRIAHITPVYPPRGGMGTVAKEYAEELCKRGENVTVFTPAYGKKEIFGARRLLSMYWGNAALVPQLLWKLRSFDVLHLHYPFYGGAFFTALASLIWKKPLVLTYHMRTKASGWLGLVFKLHRWLLEPFILWKATRILVSSFDYADSVGIEGKKVAEMPFGIDEKRFFPGTSTVRSKLGIEEDETVFLFVGGLDAAHYFKGIDGLLRACWGLKERDAWRLLIVGDGGERKTYEKLAKKLGLGGRVIFAGRVSSEELPDYYRAANVHLLPSIDRSEAYGMVTLEAAASGVPSIVSDLPGVRTLVEVGKTGWIISPGETRGLLRVMEEALQDGEKVRRFGVHARKRVEGQYRQEACITDLQELYKAVTVNR